VRKGIRDERPAATPVPTKCRLHAVGELNAAGSPRIKTVALHADATATFVPHLLSLPSNLSGLAPGGRPVPGAARAGAGLR
jgi:hypothetical protein